MGVIMGLTPHFIEKNNLQPGQWVQFVRDENVRDERALPVGFYKVLSRNDLWASRVEFFLIDQDGKLFEYSTEPGVLTEYGAYRGSVNYNKPRRFVGLPSDLKFKVLSDEEIKKEIKNIDTLETISKAVSEKVNAIQESVKHHTEILQGHDLLARVQKKSKE